MNECVLQNVRTLTGYIVLICCNVSEKQLVVICTFDFH